MLFRDGGVSAPQRPAVPPHVARQAVEWWVDLSSDLATDATRAGLARWRKESPLHEAAWHHIETINGRLTRLASELSTDAARAALLAPHTKRRRSAVKALAVLLFAGGAAWTVERRAPWQDWRADLRTAVGERRSVVLADRTTVILNTDSAVDIRFDETTRGVHLLRGEIMVTSGRDVRSVPRPLAVFTAQGELRPIGTRFAVRQQAAASRVEVFEGAVSVAPFDSDGPAQVVAAGEGARFTRIALDPPDPLAEHAAAWTDGMLVAAGMRLADLLDEIGRYRRGRVDCDPAVADLRVSGTYPLGDTDRILDALRATLPVEIRFFTRYWVHVVPVRA